MKNEIKHKALIGILCFQNSNTYLATSKITEFEISASGEKFSSPVNPTVN
jgi:translation initiation factor 6 (eIF-6)